MTTAAIFLRLYLVFCDSHLYSDPNSTVFNVHIPGRWEPTTHLVYKWGLLLTASRVALVVQNLPAHAEDWDSIPGSGRCSGVGNDTPHQCSCLENFMNRGAWQAMVHGLTKSWTRLWELACTRDLGKCVAKKGNSQYFKSANSSEVTQSCPTLCDPMYSNLYQAPLSIGFSRQEYWRGLPFPSPGNLPDPGVKPRSSAL